MNKAECISLSQKLLKSTNIQPLINNKDNSFIYVAGSIMEGFGNEKSDIDLFFFSEELPDEKSIKNFKKNNLNSNIFVSSKDVIITLTYENIDFDLEFHKTEDLSTYINKINEVRGKKGDHYIDLIHRMKYAEPIYNEKAYFDKFNNINFDKFNDIMIRHLSMIYSIKTTDILGSYIKKDYKSSFFISWFLLENCIDSYLALHGETNPNVKWRIKKIERLMNKPQYNGLNLWEIINLPFENFDIYDDEILKNKTIDILKQCQLINNIIQEEKNEY